MVSFAFLFLLRPEANAGGGQVSPGTRWLSPWPCTRILFPSFPSGEELCFLAQPTLEFGNSPASASPPWNYVPPRPAFVRYLVLCSITLNNWACQAQRHRPEGLGFRGQKSVDTDLKVILGYRARESNVGYLRPRLWGENTMRLNPGGRYQCFYLKLKP